MLPLLGSLHGNLRRCVRWQSAPMRYNLLSRPGTLDAFALRSKSALSLGEGGLDQETSHSVGVHVGSRPPVLQVAIVLELHSSSMQVSGALLISWGTKNDGAAESMTKAPTATLVAQILIRRSGLKVNCARPMPHVYVTRACSTVTRQGGVR